jgi:hypothetical protein
MAKRLGWYLPEKLLLKITLVGSEPKIWRRVEVHSGLTLHELHYVIQCIFNWEDSHLYQFHVTPSGKLTRAAMRKAMRYHLLPPDPVFGDDDQSGGQSDEVMVGQIFNDERKQIVYEYDFGDSWEHLVKLEKRAAGGEEDHVPVCLAGENAAPLDDMGGIYGYYDTLAALQDPEDEMHEEAMAWLSKDFDPARFDLERANRRLAAAFKPVPKKRRKKGG